MLGPGSSGKFRRHLLQIHRRREEEGKGWGEKQEGRIEIKPLQDGQWKRALSTRRTGSPGGSVGSHHTGKELIRQLLVPVLARADQGYVLSMSHVGNLITAAGQMCSPLTAHPSEQQNLPLLGAQQGKSCDLSQALEKH